MSRAQLPNRRQNITTEAIWTDGEAQVIPMAVCTGYGDDGRPGEVFVDALDKASHSVMRAILADAAVLISIARQHGVTAEQLAKSLSRQPIWLIVDGERRMVEAPGSPIGTVVEALQDAKEMARPERLARIASLVGAMFKARGK